MIVEAGHYALALALGLSLLQCAIPFWGARTKPFLLACYAAMLALLALTGWLAGLSPLFWPALLLPAALLLRQAAVLDIHDPAKCLSLFHSNREAGLAVALAFLIGRW